MKRLKKKRRKQKHSEAAPCSQSDPPTTADVVSSGNVPSYAPPSQVGRKWGFEQYRGNLFYQISIIQICECTVTIAHILRQMSFPKSMLLGSTPLPNPCPVPTTNQGGWDIIVIGA